MRISRCPALTPERESRIVRELAAQLEDFYREALARGATEAEADAHRARADHRLGPHGAGRAGTPTGAMPRPRLDRLAEPRLETVADDQTRGGRRCSPTSSRDMRYAVRQLCKTPGFTDGRDPDAGARHRRHQRDLQRRQRRAAAAAAISGPERAWCGSTRSCRSTAASRSRRRRFLDWRQQNTVFERIAAYSRRHATFNCRQPGPERHRRCRGVVGSVRAAAGRGRRSAARSARTKTRPARTASSSSATACGSGGSAAIPACSAGRVTLNGDAGHDHRRHAGGLLLSRRDEASSGGRSR